MPESCRHLTASHAHSHPCLVVFYTIPIFHIFLIRYLLVYFFFLHTCAQVPTIIVHNCAKIGGKSTQVIGINDIYKFLLPEAIYKLVILPENLS